MVYVPPGIGKNNNVQPKKESPFIFSLLNLTNVITNLFIGAVSMHLLTYVNALWTWESQIIRQHVYLCVFGFIILMPQAFLSTRPAGWASSFSAQNKKIVRYSLQVVGSSLGLAGGLVMVVDEGVYSSHSVLGIFLMLFTTVRLLIGGGKLFSLKECLRKDFVNVMYSVLEYLIIVFAFVAMSCAFPWHDHPYFNILGYTNHIIFLIFVYLTLLLILALGIMTSRKLLMYVGISEEQNENKTESVPY